MSYFHTVKIKNLLKDIEKVDIAFESCIYDIQPPNWWSIYFHPTINIDFSAVIKMKLISIFRRYDLYSQTLMVMYYVRMNFIKPFCSIVLELFHWIKLVLDFDWTVSLPLTNIHKLSKCNPWAWYWNETEWCRWTKNVSYARQMDLIYNCIKTHLTISAVNVFIVFNSAMHIFMLCCRCIHRRWLDSHKMTAWFTFFIMWSSAVHWLQALRQVYCHLENKFEANWILMNKSTKIPARKKGYGMKGCIPTDIMSNWWNVFMITWSSIKCYR